MRIATVLVLVVVAIAAALWLQKGSVKPAARVLNEDIYWVQLGTEMSPDESFAYIVDDMVSQELATLLDIDTSPEAAREYIEKMAPGTFADERVKNDQAVAARVADALEMVLVDGVPEDKAYEELRLDEIMSVSRWELLISTSSPDHIPTLRRFSSAEAPLDKPEITEQIMRAYLVRALRDKVCALPDRYDKIRGRLLEKVGGDLSDPLLKNVSVFEAECEVEFTIYVNEFLSKAVSVYRDELRDYSSHLSVLRGKN